MTVNFILSFLSLLATKPSRNGVVVISTSSSSIVSADGVTAGSVDAHFVWLRVVMRGHVTNLLHLDEFQWLS
jgi:hypothetical protein